MRADLGWRLDPTVAYLNHGSFGACPEPVLAAQREWRDRLEREPVTFLERELEDHLAEARAAVGRFLGADPDGLAFVTNATAGLNAVLGSLPFEPGDEVLTTDHEYNAALTTIQAAARRTGARPVIAAVPFPIGDPDDAVAAVLGAVTPRTRLVVISHVTSSTGLVLPVDRIVRALAEEGVDTLVDGAHAPGVVPLELNALRAAYYTGNGHKWLCGPKGSAFLWVRADRRELIHPAIVSHGANDPRAKPPRFRLEFDWTGTPDPTAALALPAAIDWMARQVHGGWAEIMRANRDLAITARDRVAGALGVEAPAPDAMLGSMAAVPVPGLTTDGEAAAFHEALFRDHLVEVPVGGWPARGARPRPDDTPRFVLLRVSAQRYNDEGDIDRLVKALEARRDTQRG